MLTASLLSTVIGTRLPGPGCLYVSQTLHFRAPVYVGDTVYARATVQELIPEKRRAILRTECLVRDKISFSTAKPSSSCPKPRVDLPLFAGTAQ